VTAPLAQNWGRWPRTWRGRPDRRGDYRGDATCETGGPHGSLPDRIVAIRVQAQRTHARSPGRLVSWRRRLASTSASAGVARISRGRNIPCHSCSSSEDATLRGLPRSIHRIFGPTPQRRRVAALSQVPEYEGPYESHPSYLARNLIGYWISRPPHREPPRPAGRLQTGSCHGSPPRRPYFWSWCW
jgi:hypothetical protein